MKISFTATKDDFRFINGTARGQVRYALDKVQARLIGSENERKILFEASDTFILVRKSFDLEATEDEDDSTHNKLLFDPDFFKRLTYLCKQKELIEVIIDFSEKTIEGKTLYCSMKSEHITDMNFPNTDSAFPRTEDYKYVVLRKDVLEHLLNSLPNGEQFLKVRLVNESTQRFKQPLVIQTGRDGSVYNEDINAIMPYLGGD